METPSKMNPLEKKRLRLSLQKKITDQMVADACSHGGSLDEIAGILNVSTKSAALYIERLLKKGLDIDITRLIPAGKRRIIEELLLETQGAGIKKIIQNSPVPVTEEEIRIVRGHLLLALKRQ